jgi:hypothetical protein
MVGGNIIKGIRNLLDLASFFKLGNLFEALSSSLDKSDISGAMSKLTSGSNVMGHTGAILIGLGGA